MPYSAKGNNIKCTFHIIFRRHFIEFVESSIMNSFFVQNHNQLNLAPPEMTKLLQCVKIYD